MASTSAVAKTTSAVLRAAIPPHLLKLTKPQFVNGTWHKPKVSPLALSRGKLLNEANLPRRWLESPDLSSTFVPTEPKKKGIDRRLNPKGHKFQRVRQKREEMITDKLAKMPKLIEAYHKEAQAARNEKAKKQLWKELLLKVPKEEPVRVIPTK